MKTPVSKIPTLLGLSLASLFFAASAGASTTLTFTNAGTENTELIATFGSNVTATSITGWDVTGANTANIALSWSRDSGGLTRWEYYNSAPWNSAIQLNAADVGKSYSVTFTPDAGYGVKIESFNFNSWGGQQYNFDWSVQRALDSVVITSGSTGLFTGSNQVVSPNFTATDSAAYKLVLTRTGGSGPNDSIAFDNLTFSQVSAVPEPSTYGLIGASALAAVAVVRRRRKVA